MVTFFLETVGHYNLEKRPTKIAKNVIMDTFGKTYRWLEQRVDYEKLKQKLKEELGPDGIVKSQEPVDSKTLFYFKDGETKIADLAAAREILQTLVDKGIISAKDMYLILGTRIYRKSLKSLTQRYGKEYEQLKKKRRRTEDVLARYLRQRRKRN